MSDRLYRFLSAADRSGPRWEIYARRMLAPLLVGASIGALLVVLLSGFSLMVQAGAVVVLALGGIVFCIRQLRWVMREQEAMRVERERWRARLERLSKD